MQRKSYHIQLDAIQLKFLLKTLSTSTSAISDYAELIADTGDRHYSALHCFGEKIYQDFNSLEKLLLEAIDKSGSK